MSKSYRGRAHFFEDGDMFFTAYKDSPEENSLYTTFCETKSGRGKARFSTNQVYVNIAVPRKGTYSEIKDALLKESVEIFKKMETKSVRRTYEKLTAAIPVKKDDGKETEVVEPFAY